MFVMTVTSMIQCCLAYLFIRKKMASWMYRGRRSLRSNRSIRSRKDSEDEYVTLDTNKDASENTQEILSNILRRKGVTEGRKLGYLNAFVNLLNKTDVFPNLGYNSDELLCCLRISLINEAPQVRAAGLRSIRYIIRSEQDVEAINRLQIPFLIARSIDVAIRNDMERIQAMRLCRKILKCAPNLFSKDLARCLSSLAKSGMEERDKLLRSCLATLSELCVLNSNVFILSGGVIGISRNILEPHPPRVIEALAGVLLFLLTHQSTRQLANVDLSMIAAPYSDTYYKHSGFERDKDDRETRISCAKIALLSILRSFPGVLHFCDPNTYSSGLRSLVEVLKLRQLETRKAVLNLLYDLLGLKLPVWTDEVSVALEAVNPSKMQDSWKLTEGFVAAEGKAILPTLSRFRPNLVEVHTALLLHTFVSNGLLEALVDVIVTSDSFISLRAAILLGELSQLVQTLLPPGCRICVPSLPSLLSHASGSGSSASCQAALSALATLSRLHAMFKRRPAPCSMFLDQTITFAGTWHKETIAGQKLSRNHIYQMIIKDTDDSMRESCVLSNKDPFSWRWSIVRTVLKSRTDPFCRIEDSNSRTFIKRITDFYKPSSNRFSKLKIGQKHSQLYTLAGCELIDFLVEMEEIEAYKALNDLLLDISNQIAAIKSGSSAHDCLFSPHHVTHSMCQDYFLFIGRLCHHHKGIKALEKAGIFQRLLELSVNTNHDCYVKLIVSSLDYSIDGMSRVILSKILKSPVEASRLYATRYLLTLARIRVSDFAKWGIELLVMQLYDTATAVSLAASDILDEICDYNPYLESLVTLRPSLLHLGDRGLLLLIRFLSLPNGFSYLYDANFVNKEIERWNNIYNIKYVHIVEAIIHDALTFHQKCETGSYTGRISNSKHVTKDAFLPPHLLGQLVQHSRGLELLSKEINILQKHCLVVRNAQCYTEDEVLNLKSSIWALAHCGSTAGGLQLISEAMEPEIITISDCLSLLAEECSHYGVRATAFYACALLASTQQGVSQLESSGWACVKHARHERFPVTEGNEGLPPVPVEGELARDTEEIHQEIRDSRRKRSTSQCSTQSATSWAAHFYIDTDGEDTEEDISSRVEQISTSPRNNNVSSSPILPPPITLKVNASQRRSQTLPHSKPPKAPSSSSNSNNKKHRRSLSESKGEFKMSTPPIITEVPRRNSLESNKKLFVKSHEISIRVRKKGITTPPITVDASDEIDSAIKLKHLNLPSVDNDKSRSNSCTDSGVSSCDDYPIKTTLSERVTTLTPIPSSASLSTLKSASQIMRGERARALSTQEDKVSISGSTGGEDTLGESWKNIQGFLALRSQYGGIKQSYYNEEQDEFNKIPRHASPAISLAAESSDQPLRRIASSLSSVCSRPPTQKVIQLSGPCYRGIALPTDLSVLFPKSRSKRTKRRRTPESFSELEEVQEAATDQEEHDLNSLSDGEESPDPILEHDTNNCLACNLLKPVQQPTSTQGSLVRAGRRISSSSRTRTDTESSGERLGDSPVLGKKLTNLLTATAATPNSTSSVSSIDMGMSQRTEEAAAALSKHAVKKEILKHVERLSNPIWAKSSRQILLQLKQKFATSFHDACLYSDVCSLLGSCAYRLSSRRCIQELFLDCPFEELYEEPANILKIQETPIQTTPFSSPSITVAEMLDTVSTTIMESNKARALDVVTEEHSAASRSSELTDLASKSPTTVFKITTSTSKTTIIENFQIMNQETEINISTNNAKIISKETISNNMTTNNTGNSQSQIDLIKNKPSTSLPLSTPEAVTTSEDNNTAAKNIMVTSTASKPIINTVTTSEDNNTAAKNIMVTSTASKPLTNPIPQAITNVKLINTGTIPKDSISNKPITSSSPIPIPEKKVAADKITNLKDSSTPIPIPQGVGKTTILITKDKKLARDTLIATTSKNNTTIKDKDNSVNTKKSESPSTVKNEIKQSKLTEKNIKVNNKSSIISNTKVSDVKINTTSTASSSNIEKHVMPTTVPIISKKNKKKK